MHRGLPGHTEAQKAVDRDRRRAKTWIRLRKDGERSGKLAQHHTCFNGPCLIAQNSRESQGHSERIKRSRFNLFGLNKKKMEQNLVPKKGNSQEPVKTKCRIGLGSLWKKGVWLLRIKLLLGRGRRKGKDFGRLVASWLDDRGMEHVVRCLAGPLDQERFEK